MDVLVRPDVHERPLVRGVDDLEAFFRQLSEQRVEVPACMRMQVELWLLHREQQRLLHDLGVCLRDTKSQRALDSGPHFLRVERHPVFDQVGSYAFEHLQWMQQGENHLDVQPRLLLDEVVDRRLDGINTGPDVIAVGSVHGLAELVSVVLVELGLDTLQQPAVERPLRGTKLLLGLAVDPEEQQDDLVAHLP